VRIAGLLGFSMLLGASTCAPGLRRIAAGPEQRALTGSRRETAVRCARTAIASPANPSSARASRHRQARARCRTPLRYEANIMIMSGSAAQTASDRNSDPCGTAVRRCPAQGVTAGHQDGGPYPGRHHPRQRRHGRACGRPQPCGRLRECRSRNRNAPRWTGPVSGEMSPGRRKDDECSPPGTSACTGSRRRGIG
jgi:hypothetical protein